MFNLEKYILDCFVPLHDVVTLKKGGGSIKNKKNVFILSTGFAAFSKLLLLFPSAIAVLFAKIVERLSNGLFASPRDAFIGQNSKNKGLGLALLSCSKTLGCIIGPLLVSGAAYFFGGVNYLILLGLVLALISVFLSFFIKTGSFELKGSDKKFLLSQVYEVFLKVRLLLVIALFFFLGRFGEKTAFVFFVGWILAFLVLTATDRQ